MHADKHLLEMYSLGWYPSPSTSVDNILFVVGIVYTCSCAQIEGETDEHVILCMFGSSEDGCRHLSILHGILFIYAPLVLSHVV